MQMQNESQREYLKNATSQFHQELKDSPGEQHLAERGLLDDELAPLVNRLRIGYVGSPLQGFEAYQGCLAIPYLRRNPKNDWFTVSIRFRKLGDKPKPKYMTMPGDRPRLYNTYGLNFPTPVVGITEGELDALTATACGLPTVGVPGAQAWRPHFADLFKGYETVLVFTDGDEPGAEFGETVASTIPQARVVPSPPGEDINSILIKDGIEAVRKKFE